MKKYIIFLIVFFILPASATETEVELLKVIDGDTVKVLMNGKKENIRLIEIDCFETQKNKRAIFQAENFHLSIDEVIKKGNYSKQALANLLKNETKIKLKWNKRDFFGRILGEIYTTSNININQYMLDDGGCMKYEQIKKKKAKKTLSN